MLDVGSHRPEFREELYLLDFKKKKIANARGFKLNNDPYQRLIITAINRSRNIYVHSFLLCENGVLQQTV